MALLRHRLFAQHADVEMPIVTYNPVPSYDPVRTSLHGDGLLLPDSRIINLHEDLRQRRLEHLDAVDVPPVSGRHELDVDDGYAWRRRVLDDQNHELSWDYLRPDGSMYARTPADDTIGNTAVFDHDERPIGAWTDLGDLWRWWTRQIIPASGQVVLISDSRFIAEELGLLDDERIVLLHQVHTPHLSGARRWNSPVGASYRSSMETLGRLDTLSLLTERQREDVARRYGDTDNLAVIANPVEVPDLPDPLPPREPGRIVMIARLDVQKRVDWAIEAFAILSKSHPGARLDVYGEGPDRLKLQQQIDEAGVADVVTLHGHDPRAPEHLWRADAAWSTSALEGYGLFILESRVRSCPVLAFDVPYGPSVQIASGIDGVLVQAGDVEALAAATADLLDHRDRLEAMRAPARAGAAAHGHMAFLEEWARAVASAIERRPHRTRIDHVEVIKLSSRRAARGRTLEAMIDVRGHGPLDEAVVHWQAYGPTSEAPIDLPVTTRVDGTTLHITGRAPAELLAGLDRPTMRLLLVWRNSAWQRELVSGGPNRVRRALRAAARVWRRA